MDACAVSIIHLKTRIDQIFKCDSLMLLKGSFRQHIPKSKKKNNTLQVFPAAMTEKMNTCPANVTGMPGIGEVASAA